MYHIRHGAQIEERATEAEAIALAKVTAKRQGTQVWVSDPKGTHVVYYDGRTAGVHVLGGVTR